jgi:hypothetical protein
MAGVAFLATGLLSRKGTARPMLIQGREYGGSTRGRIMWDTASPAHLRLTPPPPRGCARLTRPKQDRVRVSLRLTPEVHGRLKALSAITQRTQQSILVQALNEFLVDHEEHLEQAGDRRLPAPD